MRNEKGSSLILALILSMVLIALGLGLTLSGLTDSGMTEEFESHERALFTAESGLGQAMLTMRGIELTTVLSSQTSVPFYVSGGPLSSRDPLAFIEARNMDLFGNVSPLGSVNLTGMLTSGTGQPQGRGRFFTRVSDNDDGDGDPLADTDGRIIVRSMGLEPSMPQERVTHGSAMKNAVAMVEAALERDFSFDMSSPFSVYGPSVTPSQNRFFDGNSFLIDGNDHSSMSIDQILHGHHHNGDPEFAAISVLNDSPGTDAEVPRDQIEDDMNANQYDNLEGADGDYGSSGPSLRDDTEMIRNSSNPDAINVFDAYFMQTFINQVTAAADMVYPDGTQLSGNGIVLGTEDDPKIVVAEGDLALSGGGTGTGILIVKGELDYSGAFDYNGLILVVGEGSIETGGANKSIIGGVYVANLQDDGSGNPTFGTPSFTLAGRSNFYFRSKSIRMAISLLPFKTLGWREITPEINVASN